MSVKATQEMCFYCFDTLTSHLDHSEDSQCEFLFENFEVPLFVTWMKEDGAHTSLRGCIGTFSPTEIHDGLKQFTLSSAFKDRRFSPIKKKELPLLHCGVSLLTNFEKVEGIHDWEIGKHGIYITFEDPNGHKRTGTYLPEVAFEQGWTKQETLESLVNKAGYHGKLTPQLQEKIHLTRYQSSKCWATYAEYCAFVQRRSE